MTLLASLNILLLYWINREKECILYLSSKLSFLFVAAIAPMNKNHTKKQHNTQHLIRPNSFNILSFLSALQKHNWYFLSKGMNDLLFFRH